MQDNDLCSNATWFTPTVKDKIDKNESTSLLTGVFSVTCKGIEEERVKKYTFESFFFHYGLTINRFNNF